MLLSEEKIREPKLIDLFVSYVHLADCRNVEWCDYWTDYVIDSPARLPQSRTRHTVIRMTLLALVLRLLADKSSNSGPIKAWSPIAILTRHLSLVMMTIGQDKLHTTGVYENDRFRIKSIMA